MHFTLFRINLYALVQPVNTYNCGRKRNVNKVFKTLCSHIYVQWASTNN